MLNYHNIWPCERAPLITHLSISYTRDSHKSTQLLITKKRTKMQLNTARCEMYNNTARKTNTNWKYDERWIFSFFFYKKTFFSRRTTRLNTLDKRIQMQSKQRKIWKRVKWVLMRFFPSFFNTLTFELVWNEIGSLSEWWDFDAIPTI